MKIMLLASTLLIATAISMPYAKDYALDELVKSGIDNSHDLQSVREEQKKVELQVAESYGKAMPTLDLSGNLSHSFKTYDDPVSITSRVNSVPAASTQDNILAGVLDGMSTGALPKANNASVETIEGLSDSMSPRATLTVRAVGADGAAKTFSVRSRIDTPEELNYYKNGGILPYVLRNLAR